MAQLRPAVAYLLLLSCFVSGCQRTDEQAVHHAVIAELIERYRTNEDHVRLFEVEGASGAWVVRAEIAPSGRVGAKRLLTCRVERSASSPSGEARWTLTAVEDRDLGANPKQ